MLDDHVCFGSATGLTTLLVSTNLPRITRSWRNDERCTAVLFDKTMVMAVYAPDSDKNLEQYEALCLVRSPSSSISTQGRSKTVLHFR